ncbi:MAG: molybdate ABC transporter substrate-binding protein [Chloroflexi bacterium]|nr:molybdate ABC transporter substrate-binding protein [Chloroflexota bacterium]
MALSNGLQSVLAPRLFLGWLLAWALLAFACAPDSGASSSQLAPSRTLTVFAASSLTEALVEVKSAFEESHPDVRISLQFAGTPTLRLQIEEGAQADLFLSADESNMSALRNSGLAEGTPAVLVTNGLVVIASKAGPVRALPDLARPGLRLALALSSVPVGHYSRTALAALGQDPSLAPDFERRVLANVVTEEPNVRQVVGKVRLGDIDAAFVYRSDLAATGPDVRAILIPAEYNVVATYLVAVMERAREPELARQLLGFLQGDRAQSIFQRYGFGAFPS